MLSVSLRLLLKGGATERSPVLPWIPETWREVITRWTGQQQTDLSYKLGPPQFHKEAPDDREELVWDMTLPSLPALAEI